MAESEWFYADGDEEGGPVNAVQLKAMVESGAVGPDSLIWKEGMADWMPAKSIRGLIPANASAKAPGRSAVLKTRPSAPAPPAGAMANSEAPVVSDLPEIRPAGSVSQRRSSHRYDVNRFGKSYGLPMLLAGLLLVLFARGCDSIGNRYVVRLKAKSDQARMLASDSEEYGEKEREEYRETADEYAKSARAAEAGNKMWGFWRECAFTFGTIVLVVGLLATGFSSEGSARTICLTMLAIIMFSLYVGGIAWIGSFATQIR